MGGKSALINSVGSRAPPPLPPVDLETSLAEGESCVHFTCLTVTCV